VKWRRSSPAKEAYFTFLDEVVNTMATAEPAPQLSEIPRVAELLRESRRGSKTAILRRVGYGAAVLPLLLAAASLLILLGRAPSPSDPPITGAPNLGSGEAVTGAGETVTLRLGDGTVVRLAPESRLRLPSRPGVREVWLDGRAYFAVTRNEQYPFRIRTHAGEAVVLGTRFDLQARPTDDLRLLVVDGSVRLATHGATLEVGDSETVTSTGQGEVSRARVDSDYVKRELEWLGDFLVFENTSLSRVAEELADHFEVTIEVLDPALAEKTVQGMFTDESLDEVLHVLCRAVSAHCVVHGDRVTISP
jgi:ferric-dicitrate binding protein FerR (iron transport regulator)